jgi:hypothetical protein
MVNNILSNISLFVFVFTVLVLLRLVFKFVGSLISYKSLKLEIRELIFYAICLSYFITYIFSV